MLLPLLLLLSAGTADARFKPHYGEDRLLLQLSWSNTARDFLGVGQIALHSNDARDFIGGLQLALALNEARGILAAAQLAPINRGREVFVLLQAGGRNLSRRYFAGAAQVGLLNEADGRLVALAQVGVANIIRAKSTLLLQAGLFNRQCRRSLRVVLRLGVANLTCRRTWALLEAGVLNHSSGHSRVLLQLGAYNHTKNYAGLIQGGAINYVEDDLFGIQLGVANFARTARGLQIGLFNYARTLRGVQIGLLNFSRHGGLPFMPLLNVSL